MDSLKAVKKESILLEDIVKKTAKTRCIDA